MAATASGLDARDSSAGRERRGRRGRRDRVGREAAASVRDDPRGAAKRGGDAPNIAKQAVAKAEAVALAQVELEAKTALIDRVAERSGTPRADAAEHKADAAVRRQLADARAAMATRRRRRRNGPVREARSRRRRRRSPTR